MKRTMAISGYAVLLSLGAALLAASPGRAQDDDGLMLWWPLNGDLLDASAEGHDGAAIGAISFAAGGGGQCLELPGDSAWVAADTALPELTDEFTIECRVNPAPEQRAYADVYGNHAEGFCGFALQQDGDRANHYYFTYGDGGRWVYSATIALEAGLWQRVTVTKDRERLRVYIDGVLVDSRSAPSPMAPSQTPFMVGLGIEGQARWFRGQVADVTVRSRAAVPEVEADAERQMSLFLASARIECTPTPEWLIFGPGEGRIDLSLSTETPPPAVEGIRVSLEASDPAGRALEQAQPEDLTARNGYRSSIPIESDPGFRRVLIKPFASVGGEMLPMRENEIAYLVPAGRPGDEDVLGSAGATGSAPPCPEVSLDGDWLLDVDPGNEGLAAGWTAGPTDAARPTRVPWIIQDAFPGYHGVAWYWRSFRAPESPFLGGRTLLRFEAVDYKADVWVNGTAVGEHKGAEGPFELDVTDAVRPGLNLLAVRVVNPTHERIDDMVLNETPRRAKVIPYSAGASYNHGGIVGSVALLRRPRVYIDDLHLTPDPETGLIGVEVTVRNSGPAAETVALDLSAAPAAGGGSVARGAKTASCAEGLSVLRGALRVSEPRRWDLDEPFLYTVTARLSGDGGADERSDRCGFREFRFEDGAFRLNGRRLFLRGTHTVNATPIGQQVPADPALFQRDLVLLKAMGFNCIRFIWGGATPRQLDMCDEMGLLVYDEHAASNPMLDNPNMKRRFDASIGQVIRRDRNHPSVVIWGLLNETPDGPVFQHAAESLPLVRSLDESRMVMLNSGRWDGRLEIGSLSNPYSAVWDGYLGAEGPGAARASATSIGGYWQSAGDAHVYPRVPHTADTVSFLRGLGRDTGPVFLSEYGIGSAVDLWRITRRFELLGKPEAEDAVFYRERLDRFLADWERWGMDEAFANPQDFFAQSLAKMAGQRTLGLNALRSSPSLAGYSLTGMMDHVNCGEGLFTLFRELKPGTVDALADGLAPLRLCLFAEPLNAYRGSAVTLEAVLANEDVLPPGEYSVRLQVVGPHGGCVFEETTAVRVPEGEAPFALPFFERSVVADWPTGEYRFLAVMQSGGAPTGGEAKLRVYDRAEFPAVGRAVTLLGPDDRLRSWLSERGVAAREFGETPAGPHEAILVAGPPSPDDAPQAWADLTERIQAGATALFVAPEALAEGDDALHWLPLEHRGGLKRIAGWLYLKDEWAKRGPVFDGLPAGGLMDYGVYRDVIPDLLFDGQGPASEAIAGAVKASQDYDSGLMVAAYSVGQGRILLSTLRLLENLGRDPVADRLLLNMLRWAEAEPR